MTGASAAPRGRYEIQAFEWRPLLASAAAYFFLLGGYYMLRSLREAYALQVGRENIDVLFYLTFLVMLVVLPAYWWLVARVTRGQLFAAVLAGISALFLVLGLALRAAPDSRILAGCFFVAVTSMNLFLVSVFWSIMVDMWRSGAAKRLFGVIAATAPALYIALAATGDAPPVAKVARRSRQTSAVLSRPIPSPKAIPALRSKSAS